MPDENPSSRQSLVSRIMMVALGLPWPEIVGELWKFGRKAMRGLSNEGMYEVIDYEAILELLDKKGERATFKKRKKIRYLQDNIIAYQDHAWGDGEILLNYHTNRGKPVDQYRYGYKTFILLSLQEIKNKGDVDEFKIQWNIRRGFLTEDGFWATDISQRTKNITVKVIFPRTRPPLKLTIEESNQKRAHTLGSEVQERLPDGRWLVTWEMKKPKLYELYVLRWIW